MAKNARFKDVYIVVIEGTTTNGFAQKSKGDFLKTACQVMNDHQEQVGVSLRKLGEAQALAVEGTIAAVKN